MVMKIDRKSSIESEPRTLGMDQIQFAREAALYVLQTNSSEEAMSIFTQGLEPVISSVVGLEEGILDIDSSDLSDEYEHRNENQFRDNQDLFRDVATAPF